jgi:hypothetical protein
MAEETQSVKKIETHTVHTTQTPIEREDRGPSLLSNILAILGFIILLAIIIWGLIHLATLASPWLSSLLNKNVPAAIEVTAPAQAISGTAFTVSWKYSPAAAGSYAFLYQCKDNFQFETPGTGGAMESIPCGAAFTVGASGNSVSVLPILSGTATTSVPLSIVFMPGAANGQQVQGNATVAIAPGAVQQPVPAQPAQTVTPAGAASAPAAARVSSPADLSVNILSVNTSASGATVATFDIANDGGSASGTYYFEAFLPTQSQYTYTSPAQASLAPGSHVLSTLTFTQTVGGTFSVLVDPSGAVRESNRSNNYASRAVSAPYNNYNGYNNYYYPQTTYPQYQQPYQYVY